MSDKPPIQPYTVTYRMKRSQEPLKAMRYGRSQADAEKAFLRAHKGVVVDSVEGEGEEL